MKTMRAPRVLVPLAVVAAACGSSHITTVNQPPNTQVTPPPPPVIVITARGVDQTILHVFEGHATFVNDDTRDHALYLDPHPTHNPSTADCSVPNVGNIPAGTRIELTNLRPSLCFFHDEAVPTDGAFRFAVLVH
jgi:hypothetical protein